MADEQEQHTPSRFRLPRLFSHAAEVAPDLTMIPAEAPSETAPGADAAGSGSLVEALTAGKKSRPDGTVAFAPAAAPATMAEPQIEVAGELTALREAVEGLSAQITQVNQRETSLERVFDALHEELADYKNDFLYEHLKPMVRPLLFLFDSLEQFDGEIALALQMEKADCAGEGLSAGMVRENVQFFRDQLAEALQVCEVTIMETPSGAFNAKVHRAVDVASVPAADDGTIVRVIRSGWYLNGQLLRPAEVVVGRFRG